MAAGEFRIFLKNFLLLLDWTNCRRYDLGSRISAMEKEGKGKMRMGKMQLYILNGEITV